MTTFGKTKIDQFPTWLSSLPDTIHFPPVTEKLAKTQYFSFMCPVYVFRHLPWRYIASSDVKTCKKVTLE